MAHLGHMYANGVGVEASNTTALEWFKQAAEKNHPSALYGLGYAHLGGLGVPKDAKKAFKYFTAAGEQVNHILHEIECLLKTCEAAKRPPQRDVRRELCAPWRL